MKNIKTAMACVALFLGLGGCATCPGWGIVNNTGYTITVTQDGAKIADLRPGQTVVLRPRSWGEASLVSVSAFRDGRYMGANSYTYSRYTPYNWQIDHVFTPEGSQ